MKKNLLPTLALIILLAFHAVAAENFGISAPSVASACYCSSSSTTFSITNTDPNQQTITYIIDGAETGSSVTSIPSISSYTIFLSGDAASWATASPNRFSLLSGQSQTIILSWTAPCSGNGKHTLTATVQTDAGNTQSFNIDMTLAQCETMRVAAVANTYNGCPCKTAVFQYTVENTGSFAEHYSISTDTLGQYMSSSDNNFALASGAKKTVSLYVTPPCEIHGDYEGTLSIEAQKSGIVAQTPYYLTIEACYAYQPYFGAMVDQNAAVPSFIPAKEPYTTCMGQATKIPILFTNKAEIANTYTMKVEEKQWASITPEEISLPGNQSRILFITPAQLAAGSYAFTVDVLTQVGNLESQFSVPYVVANCNTPELSIQDMRVDYVEADTPITLTNTGTKAASYRIKLNAPAWADVSPITANVAAGGSMQLSFKTNPDLNVSPGDYASAIVVENNDGTGSYEFPFTISVGEKSGISQFFSLYKWYLIGAMLFLIILLVAFAIGMRTRKAAEPQEEPYTHEQIIEPVAKKIKEEKKARAIREERRAERKVERAQEPERKQPEERTANGTNLWMTVGFIVFVIAALAGMGYFGYQYYKEHKAATPPAEEAPPVYHGGSMFNISPEETGGNATGAVETPEQAPTGQTLWTKAKASMTRLKSTVLPYYWYLVGAVAIIVAIWIIVSLWHVIALRKWLIALIILLIIIAAIVAGYLYYLKPIFSQRNETQGPAVVPGAEPEYTQDAILSVIEGGSYGYDQNGDVVNTETGITLTTEEFIGLIKGNRETILTETEMTETELNSTITALEKMVIGAAPEEPAPEIDCTVTMQKDTTLLLNLSTSFIDPDNEILRYEATAPEHVSVSIEGEMAELVPETGFVGTDSVLFVAADASGATTSSGALTICVKEGEKISLMDSYGKRIKEFLVLYALYIGAGLVILVGLIIALRIRKPADMSKPTEPFADAEAPRPKRKARAKRR